MGAIQDWKKGVISLCDRKGDVKWFDMESKEPISDVDEDEEEDEDTSDSTGSEESSTSSSESEGEANVSYLLVDEEEQEKVPNVFDVQDGEELDRKSTRLNSSHSGESRMPSSA